MHPRDRIAARIEALRVAGQWRDPNPPIEAAGNAGDTHWIDARSNDYLGLGASFVSRETEVRGRVGSGASRLISGTHSEHLELERALADWLQFEASLVFSSGYSANIGAISALAGPGETIYSDALNHASIIDGCRLSRANLVVFPHRDLIALKQALGRSVGVRWVVTESYFSMDGDSPNLEELRRLCDRTEAALVVDEAHALGVFGPEGRGLCARSGVQPDVLIGGLGKACGAQGGFAACSRLFRGWLWNRARSLVFSTAPSPLATGITLSQLARLRSARMERQHLHAIGERLAEALTNAGVAVAPGRHGPIFPVIFGGEEAALSAARITAALGVLCHPVRPPTVPPGTSRLRVTLRADMNEAAVDRIAGAMIAAWRRAGPASAFSVSRETDARGDTGAAPEELASNSADVGLRRAPESEPALAGESGEVSGSRRGSRSDRA